PQVVVGDGDTEGVEKRGVIDGREGRGPGFRTGGTGTPPAHRNFSRAAQRGSSGSYSPDTPSGSGVSEQSQPSAHCGFKGRVRPASSMTDCSRSILSPLISGSSSPSSSSSASPVTKSS